MYLRPLCMWRASCLYTDPIGRVADIGDRLSWLLHTTSLKGEAVDHVVCGVGADCNPREVWVFEDAWSSDVARMTSGIMGARCLWQPALMQVHSALRVARRQAGGARRAARAGRDAAPFCSSAGSRGRAAGCGGRAARGFS
jgi:hypothetical protein